MKSIFIFLVVFLVVACTTGQEVPPKEIKGIGTHGEVIWGKPNPCANIPNCNVMKGRVVSK